VRRKLLKKIILILEALLMTAFVMAEEKHMKKNADTIQLNSGFNMPVLGLGTWTLTGATCENAVYAALKSGYRLIDTAKYYGNESEVGNAIRRAIKDGICKREEIFVTTKLVPWSNNPDRDIDDSLKQLGLSYIDLCLLHQHGSSSGDDAVYKAMIRAVKAGKIRSIGISNFYTEKTVSHFIKDFEIPPAVIQNENHLKYQNNSLRDSATQKSICKMRLCWKSLVPTASRLHKSSSAGICNLATSQFPEVQTRHTLQKTLMSGILNLL